MLILIPASMATVEYIEILSLLNEMKQFNNNAADRM